MISNDTVAQFKPHVPKCNEDTTENRLDRNFHNQPKHHVMDETLKAFEIERSLNMKGCLYDNAVAEATYKIIYCAKLISLT